MRPAARQGPLRRGLILHDRTSGEGSDPADAVRPVRAAGLRAEVVGTDDPGWREALAEALGWADVLVAAAGDGTVRRAAEALEARGAEARGAPLAILPLGTANNVATSLGLSRDGLEAALRGGRRLPLDLAAATGPWGRRVLVESAGTGLLAEAAREASDSDRKPKGAAKLRFARDVLRRRLEAGLSAARGEAPFFVVALIRSLCGPRLRLAPANC